MASANQKPVLPEPAAVVKTERGPRSVISALSPERRWVRDAAVRIMN